MNAHFSCLSLMFPVHIYYDQKFVKTYAKEGILKLVMHVRLEPHPSTLYEIYQTLTLMLNFGARTFSIAGRRRCHRVVGENHITVVHRRRTTELGGESEARRWHPE